MVISILVTVMIFNFSFMKKSVYSILAALAVVFALVSCAKEAQTPDDEVAPKEVEAVEEQEELVELTLIAGNPEAEPATKTEMVGSAPYWSVGDAIGVSNGTSTNYRFETAITSPSTTATFTGATSVSSTLYAYYPFQSNGNSPVTSKGAKVDIAATQHPTATSFDGAADIMVAKEFTVDPANTTVSNLEFKRLGAIVKVVLKDADSKMAGTQHPSSVSLTAESDLVGRVYIDMVNQEIESSEGIYYNASPTVTAAYTYSTQYELDGTNAAYFVVYPQILAEGTTLTVAAMTEGYEISKDITVPTGGINLQAGKITTLNVNLLAAHITAVTSGLELPFSDDFSWQTATSGSITTTVPSDKYSSFSTLYADKGAGKVRMSSASDVGNLTTVNLNLSSPFHVIVNAEIYNTNQTKIKVSVDDGAAQVASDYLGTAKDYIFNFPAATSKSKVKIFTEGKQAVLNSIQIISGTYVFPPVIDVTSDNPMGIANTSGTHTIEYTIDNPTSESISASANVTWIHDFDYSVDGEVSFDVDAQSSGDPARSGVITLSYTGAEDVTVTVNQAAGAGGTTTKTLTITSAEVVSNSGYNKYENDDWIITFGGNNKSVGTNSTNRSNCNLSNYSKYAVSPVTTSSVASAFASKTSRSNVKKVSYTFNGGSNQTNTKVYLLYSANGTTFSQITLTSGTQGATISSGTEYEFAKCTGYFAVLFEATNSSGNWRIDDVALTFTYEE